MQQGITPVYLGIGQETSPGQRAERTGCRTTPKCHTRIKCARHAALPGVQSRKTEYKIRNGPAGGGRFAGIVPPATMRASGRSIGCFPSQGGTIPALRSGAVKPSVDFSGNFLFRSHLQSCLPSESSVWPESLTGAPEQQPGTAFGPVEPQPFPNAQQQAGLASTSASATAANCLIQISISGGSTMPCAKWNASRFLGKPCVRQRAFTSPRMQRQAAYAENMVACAASVICLASGCFASRSPVMA